MPARALQEPSSMISTCSGTDTDGACRWSGPTVGTGAPA